MSPLDNRPSDRARFLQASPLFFDLHADEIALLAELCQCLTFSAGEIVFRENDPGDSLYIVHKGEVEVIQEADGPEASSRVLTGLKRGEFFGEMSMLEKSTRSATIRCVTDTALLTLTTEDFYSFAKIFRNGFTVVIINIARILSRRLRQTTEMLRHV